jgi:hypothetical protein
VANVYCERAAYCHEMAAKAPTNEIKAGWLRTAEIWLLMAGNNAAVLITNGTDQVDRRRPLDRHGCLYSFENVR